VGTHVSVFPSHLLRPCRRFSDKIRSWARSLVCSQRISNGHTVASLIIIRSLRWAHTLVCSQRIGNGRAVASLLIIRSLQWAHTLMCSQRICNGQAVVALW
jgi:hypothetical protein